MLAVTEKRHSGWSLRGSEGPAKVTVLLECIFSRLAVVFVTVLKFGAEKRQRMSPPHDPIRFKWRRLYLLKGEEELPIFVLFLTEPHQP
jgi:hypothetical protein